MTQQGRREKWIEDIKDTLQQYGLTINDATRQTRARWREDIKDILQQNGLRGH
jgi:1,2-phenylacetyl-CoA epoxidase catalytic subunit